MRAIRVHQHGGPEAMALDDVATPTPGPGQALVRLHTAGVNFIDVYFRTGLYKADLPAGLGNEGAISLAKFVMLAKIAADYAIGRIVKLQYRRQHMHGGFKLRGGEFQSKA